MQHPESKRSVTTILSVTGHADRAGALIAAAFDRLEVAQWLITDGIERQRVLSGQFTMLVDHVMHTGGWVDVAVDDASDWTGVAVWADRARPAAAPPRYDERLAALAGPHLPRLQTLDAAFEAHHPVAPPHHHLMFLAVAPSVHGNGIGTDLLRHGLDRVDDAGHAAYLEAASADLCRLYARHGFTASDPITLPDDGPHLYPMLRLGH